MRNLTFTAMVALLAVSQVQGQLNGDSTQAVPPSPIAPADHDTTRGQVLALVSVVSAVAAVGAVVLAYRHMSRADAAYGRYLNAGDPSRMNRYFNEARDHDRKAGTSLAIFEVCFAISVYSTYSSLTL